MLMTLVILGEKKLHGFESCQESQIPRKCELAHTSQELRMDMVVNYVVE